MSATYYRYRHLRDVSMRGTHVQHNKSTKTTFYLFLHLLPQIPKQSSSQRGWLPLESKGILLLRKKVLRARLKPSFDSFLLGPRLFYEPMISKEQAKATEGLEQGSAYYGLLAKSRLLPAFIWPLSEDFFFLFLF